jgi:hypothetical protein
MRTLITTSGSTKSKPVENVDQNSSYGFDVVTFGEAVLTTDQVEVKFIHLIGVGERLKAATISKFYALQHGEPPKSRG